MAERGLVAAQESEDQHYATVARVTDEGVYVTLDATFPPNQELVRLVS